MINLLKNLFLACLSILIGLLMAEIFLRIALPDKGGELISISFSKDFVEKDNVLGYAGVPHAEGICYNCETKVSYKLNSKGFRDDEHYLEKSKSLYRILVLGDSFVWGVGVEQKDLFTKLLQNMNPDTEVMNVSVPGWSTNQEYFYMENYGIQYKPDMVIVVFFIENDAHGNALYEKNGFEDYTPPENKEKKYKVFSKKYLQDHSRIYRLWKRKRRDLKIQWGLDPILTEYDKNSAEWKATEKWILKFKDLATQNNFKLIFVLAPGRNQFLVKRDGNKPQKMLKSFFDNQNIEYIDLFPVFQDVKNANRNNWGYFKYDGHWNKEGHQIVVDEINRVVSRNLTNSAISN